MQAAGVVVRSHMGHWRDLYSHLKTLLNGSPPGCQLIVQLCTGALKLT
jgi:hypothetical protein